MFDSDIEFALLGLRLTIRNGLQDLTDAGININDKLVVDLYTGLFEVLSEVVTESNDKLIGAMRDLGLTNKLTVDEV